MKYQHVVWLLPDRDAYDNCKYGLAEFAGNETAGQGIGFWVTATEKPQYFGCGVFGHCEYFDQKVRTLSLLWLLLGFATEAPQCFLLL